MSDPKFPTTNANLLGHQIPKTADRLVNFRPTMPPLSTNPAKWMFERLIESIVEFEKRLDQTQEIGARLVNFGEREAIHINDVGYHGPHLVVFYGTNLDGHPVELLQHVTQVSVLLVAVPKEHERPRRIGFELQRKLEPEEKSVE